MFVRNAWYVAGWSSEVHGEKPLGRMILNEPITLFRTSEGKVAAVESRCAHRGMPLTHGRVVGDRLVCGYHGLSYDVTGKCVRIPGQSEPPKNISVRRYPVVERYGAIWVWTGDPALANEANIFGCDLAAQDGSDGLRLYFHVKSNYLYINDNLSDLLHQAYLHNPSFGGNANSLGETLPTITKAGRRIHVNWDWNGVQVPKTFVEYGNISDIGDGWNHSTFEAPSFYINFTGFSDPDQGGFKSQLPQGEGRFSFTVYQLITPETETSTHFFKIVSACDAPASLLAKIPPLAERVNGEDIWACEEQQRMHDLNPKAKMTLIPTDRPVMEMRRVLDRLLRDEKNAVNS